MFGKYIIEIKIILKNQLEYGLDGIQNFLRNLKKLRRSLIRK
ncbi:MAG: hypothetical protein ACI9JT_002377 [Polaribacter sp.]|jgi:hypothetical protein